MYGCVDGDVVGEEDVVGVVPVSGILWGLLLVACIGVGARRTAMERQCGHVGLQPTKSPKCSFSAAFGRNAGTLSHTNANPG